MASILVENLAAKAKLWVPTGKANTMLIVDTVTSQKLVITAGWFGNVGVADRKRPILNTNLGSYLKSETMNI